MPPSVVRKGLDNVAATNSLDTTDGFDNVNNASGNDTSGNDTSSNVVIDLAGSWYTLPDYLATIVRL